MWFALKLLGFGKTLLNMGLRFVAWLCEDWLRLVVAGFVILSAVLWFRGNDYRAERNDAQAGWQAEIAAHKQTEANYRAASAAALAAAQENKVRVETKYKVIENAQDKDIRARLAAATASLRARAASSDSSGPQRINLPSPSSAAFDTAGTSSDPIMDGALICTANSVKAQGWLDWYKQIQTVPIQ
jgi:hypothetical protein